MALLCLPQSSCCPMGFPHDEGVNPTELESFNPLNNVLSPQLIEGCIS